MLKIFAALGLLELGLQLIILLFEDVDLLRGLCFELSQFCLQKLDIGYFVFLNTLHLLFGCSHQLFHFSHAFFIL